MVEAIHKEDPNRLVVADGRDYGNKPPTELVGLGVASATRGYAPFHLTHYKANWVEGSDRWPKPTYPLEGRQLDLGQVESRAATRSSPGRPWRRRAWA